MHQILPHCSRLIYFAFLLQDSNPTMSQKLPADSVKEMGPGNFLYYVVDCVRCHYPTHI